MTSVIIRGHGIWVMRGENEVKSSRLNDGEIREIISNYAYNNAYETNIFNDFLHGVSRPASIVEDNPIIVNSRRRRIHFEVEPEPIRRRQIIFVPEITSTVATAILKLRNDSGNLPFPTRINIELIRNQAQKLRDELKSSFKGHEVREIFKAVNEIRSRPHYSNFANFINKSGQAFRYAEAKAFVELYNYQFS